MTPNEYRKKHRRCITCQYLETNAAYDTFLGKSIGKCTVQEVNKFIYDGRHCRVYKAKEFEE